MSIVRKLSGYHGQYDLWSQRNLGHFFRSRDSKVTGVKSILQEEVIAPQVYEPVNFIQMFRVALPMCLANRTIRWVVSRCNILCFSERNFIGLSRFDGFKYFRGSLSPSSFLLPSSVSHHFLQTTLTRSSYTTITATFRQPRTTQRTLSRPRPMRIPVHTDRFSQSQPGRLFI